MMVLNGVKGGGVEGYALRASSSEGPSPGLSRQASECLGPEMQKRRHAFMTALRSKL